MISNQEFQRKLLTGKIHEALSLVMKEAIELDITTRLTGDLTNNPSAEHEYLRTKINLLTGNIENEVGEQVLNDSIKYLRFQKLHNDRVVASHRLVRDYLQQITAVLTALPPIPSGNSPSVDLTDSDNLPSVPAVSSSEGTRFPVDEIAADADDIDLSIDHEGDVWEEWVEDENVSSGSGIPPSQVTLPESTLLSDRTKHSVQRSLNPLTVKPIHPRAPSIPADTLTHWDDFAPEYIGIGTDPQPRIVTDSGEDRLNKLLADLDI